MAIDANSLYAASKSIIDSYLMLKAEGYDLNVDDYLLVREAALKELSTSAVVYKGNITTKNVDVTMPEKNAAPAVMNEMPAIRDNSNASNKMMPLKDVADTTAVANVEISKRQEKPIKLTLPKPSDNISEFDILRSAGDEWN